MRRPIPSEEFLLKAQMRRKNSCDKMIELCQSESEVLQPRFKCDAEENAFNQDPVQEDVPNFLRSEQHLADVIQRILPAEKFKCSNSNFRPSSKTVTLRLASKPTKRGTKRGTIFRGSVEPGLPLEAAKMALLRKDRVWDPKTFPLRKNSIDLVKGACAQSIERVLGGKFVFLQEAPRHGRRKRKGHPLHDFREKLLQKWPTIQDAFAAIDSYLSKVTKEMNLQEWAAAMTNLGLASMQDARVIYELLDENKDGDVTLEEFHWGIETVAPVLCMETLRKRLLCLGFPSMMTALSAMHGPGQDMTMLPLSFDRFSEYLSRAWVIQPEEHRAIFNSIRNPNDPSQTVTLSELLCGLAGVAPPLVLEDLATALKPPGRLAELKEALGVSNEQEEVSADKWQRILKKMFHFSEIDCKKLLPMMDVDGIDGISVGELKSVLMFAEPIISVEGSRKRVQQGYRSIETVLHTMVDESPDFAEDSKFGKEELQILLESVDGVEMWEMAPVVNFLSGDSVHGISIGGFLKGLRLFAPCCVLEALRMQLLQQGMLTFKEVPSHRAPLDREGFVASLKRVGVELSTEDTSAIFELLDIRSSGVVTISELIALLQCSRPKCRQWRPERELQRQAAFAVQKDFAPIQNGLKELKHGIRVARQEADEQCEDGGGVSAPSVQCSVAKAAKVVAAKTMTSSSSAPELRRGAPPAPAAPFARRTFQRITSTLSRVPEHENGSKIGEIREELDGYFESHERFVGDHEQLLLQPVPKADSLAYGAARTRHRLRA